MDIERQEIKMTDYGYFSCINISLDEILDGINEEQSHLYKYKFEVEAKYKKLKNKIHVDVPLSIIMMRNYYEDLDFSKNDIDEIINK